MRKVILIEKGNFTSDGTTVVSLFADVDDSSEITNEDIDMAFDHTLISGGSTIYTRAFNEFGTFRDDKQGVDSIDWGE